MEMEILKKIQSYIIENICLNNDKKTRQFWKENNYIMFFE